VDSAGTRHSGRYQILPAAGLRISTPRRRRRPRDYMFEISVDGSPGADPLHAGRQLANPGDPTNDGLRRVAGRPQAGDPRTISLTAIAPDNETLQRSLAFSPIYLTDGIQLSDDPFRHCARRCTHCRCSTGGRPLPRRTERALH